MRWAGVLTLPDDQIVSHRAAFSSRGCRRLKGATETRLRGHGETEQVRSQRPRLPCAFTWVSKQSAPVLPLGGDMASQCMFANKTFYVHRCSGKPGVTSLSLSRVPAHAQAKLMTSILQRRIKAVVLALKQFSVQQACERKAGRMRRWKRSGGRELPCPENNDTPGEGIATCWIMAMII